MKNAVIITVRMKSTRLKKKVLLEYKNKSILKYLTDRLKYNFNERIIICTSTHSDDDVLIDFARQENVDYFRGSEDDVLDRYYKTSKSFNIEKCYIVYGDEPFTDIDTMNKNFEMLDVNEAMWIKNDSLPEGTYGYGMTFKGIQYINKHKLSNSLEVWQIMASKMPLKKINYKTEFKEKFDKVRLTIDYKEDFEVFKSIIDKIGDKYQNISLDELTNLYINCELYKINGFRIEDYKERIKNQGAILP